MSNPKSALSIVRSLVIMAAVGVITTGATFAALQSPNASLTSNIINSGSADLRISKDGNVFTVPSVAGFTFDGVVPGGAPAPSNGNIFYLKNYGTVNLAVKAGISTNPSNVSGVDLSKTYLIFTRTDTSGPPVSLSLKSLIDGYASGGTALGDTVAAGSTAAYNIKASMDADAFSGASASITGINLAFSGIGT